MQLGNKIILQVSSLQGELSNSAKLPQYNMSDAQVSLTLLLLAPHYANMVFTSPQRSSSSVCLPSSHVWPKTTTLAYFLILLEKRSAGNPSLRDLVFTGYSLFTLLSLTLGIHLPCITLTNLRHLVLQSSFLFQYSITFKQYFESLMQPFNILSATHLRTESWHAKTLHNKGFSSLTFQTFYCNLAYIQRSVQILCVPLNEFLKLITPV